MDAHVFKMRDGNYMVSLRDQKSHKQIDLAGPFYDSSEAIAMAKRAVYGKGSVTVGRVGSALAAPSYGQAIEEAA